MAEKLGGMDFVWGIVHGYLFIIGLVIAVLGIAITTANKLGVFIWLIGAACIVGAMYFHAKNIKKSKLNIIKIIINVFFLAFLTLGIIAIYQTTY